MRWLILKFIGRFGRYAAVPVAIAGFCLLVAWLEAYDRWPLYALLLLPVVFPIPLASISLLFGVVLAGLKAPPRPYASLEEAPGLWRQWDELSPPSWWQKRVMRVDDRFNASIGARSRLLGLALPEVTMTVGLPLLHELDEPMVRAVIAHEVGHDLCRHTYGLSNVVEFEQALWEVFDSFPPHRTVAGSVLFGLLGWLGDWLKSEELRLSRIAEFEADAIAARSTGQGAIAATLTMVDAAGEHYRHDYIDKVYNTLVQMTDVPPSPLELLLAEQQRPSPVEYLHFAQEAFGKPHDPASTHPVLAERLAAIGVTGLPELAPAGPRASATLITPELTETVLAEHKRQWKRDVTRYLRLE